jgi:inorganic pyrophosphatase
VPRGSGRKRVRPDERRDRATDASHRTGGASGKLSSGQVLVVIETPRGSASKLAFDPDLRAFRLSKVLPVGMTFPVDFGFVPGTRAPDGDALDVAVVLTEPLPVGTVVRCRLVAVIEAEQRDKGGPWMRNDRLVAVPVDDQRQAHINDRRDLDGQWMTELEAFFTNYHLADGSRFRVRACHGRKRATRLLELAGRVAEGSPAR